MAVARDTDSGATNDSSGAGVTSFTQAASFITPGASASALIVHAIFDSVVTSATCHWDSAGTNQLMTNLGSQTSSGGAPPQLYLFGLRNPTTGSGKLLHFTWTTAAQLFLSAITFTGNDTSSDANAFKSFTSNNTAALNPSVAPVSTVNDFCTGALILNSASDINSWTAGTSLYINVNIGAVYRAGQAGTTALTANTTGSGSLGICGITVAAPLAADVLQSQGLM